MQADSEDNYPTYLIDTLKLSIEKACRGEKSFIRSCTVAVFMISLFQIFKHLASDISISIKFFGITNFPKNALIEQGSLISIFLSAWVIYSFSEWSLSIIDLNRHPAFSVYSVKKSLVVIIADTWDSRIHYRSFKMMSILDFMQKITFIVMGILIIGKLFSIIF